MASLRLRIGELAALTGRSVHTIRWYEAQGLLPAVPRQGGQRIYSRRHLEWLELMEHLRRSGMSVAELREYTRLAQQGGATLRPTLAVLTAHKALVEDKLAQWQQALGIIEGKIAFYRRWIDTGRRPAPAHGKNADSEEKMVSARIQRT